MEQLKEAAKYQMQVDNYETEKLQLLLQEDALLIDKSWRVFSQSFDLFLSSFVKAAEEDANFDSEISNFLSQIISFLEDFELGSTKKRDSKFEKGDKDTIKTTDNIEVPNANVRLPNLEKHVENLDDIDNITKTEATDIPGMWFLRDLFGGDTKKNDNSSSTNGAVPAKDDNGKEPFGEESYNKVYAFLTILMRTISIARAGCTDKPNLKVRIQYHNSHLYALYFAHTLTK